MAKRLPSLTGDLKQISECSLCRDPRVSERARLHTFCRGCMETVIINQESCPLCRPFFRIPEDGCGSIPTNYVEGTLVDLHQEYLEKKLNLKDEKVIDIPLIEQFILNEAIDTFAYIAWLENKIYILFLNSTTVRVFIDQAPFDELLEAIQIPELGKPPMVMTLCAAGRAIFLSDGFGFIYKIQMPNGRISRWKSSSLDGKSGAITRMSNSTVLDDCLVASFLHDADSDESFQYELQLFSQLDGDLHRHSVIPLPDDMQYIGHVVHSPGNNFVISYSKTSPFTECWICILSCDGERIRTFEPESGSVNPSLSPFDIDDDGQIFVADFFGNKVICMNSNLTDYRIILQKDREIESPCTIVYIPEKRQLLVRGRKGPDGRSHSISVFHLSPCKIVQQRE